MYTLVVVTFLCREACTRICHQFKPGNEVASFGINICEVLVTRNLEVYLCGGGGALNQFLFKSGSCSRMNSVVLGTVTDGEFCSLRSRGETRALHFWQLIHDIRESAQKLSKKILLEMLILIGSKLNWCKFKCVSLKKHVLVAFYSHIRLRAPFVYC